MNRPKKKSGPFAAPDSRPWRDDEGRVVDDGKMRSSPSSIEAERGLLGACLLEGGAAVLRQCLAAGFTPPHFYHTAHQLIFEAMLELEKRAEPADTILLSNQLKAAGHLDDIGGHAYLFELAGAVQTTIHAGHWLKVVKEKHLLRQLIRAAQWTVEQAHGDGQADVTDLMAGVERAFGQLQEMAVKSDAVSGVQIVEQAMERARKDLANEEDPEDKRRLVTTGLRGIDEAFVPARPGQMVLLGARPSVGKSSLGRQILWESIMKEQNSMLFTLEVPRLRIIDQLAALPAQINLKCKLRDIRQQPADRRGVTGEWRVQKFLETQKLLRDIADRRFWFYDGSLYWEDVVTRCRLVAQRFGGLGLVMIDYLQLLNTREKFQNRELEVAAMSKGCKRLASELQCVVLVLAQLNREAADEKPQKKHLRESGALEQDADKIWFLHRPKRDCNNTEQGLERVEYQQLLIQDKGRDDGTAERWVNFYTPTTYFHEPPPTGQRGRPAGVHNGEGSAPVFHPPITTQQAMRLDQGGSQPLPGAFRG